jgi:hypothetical protein
VSARGFSRVKKNGTKCLPRCRRPARSALLRIIPAMLSDIDKVDWKSLNHAYGAASDVPKLLRQLATGPAPERKQALYDLHGNLWHQGTVYQATAHAVPFLLELLQSERDDFPELLAYLFLLANGSSYLQVHRQYQKQWTEAHDQQLAQELEWVRQTQAAVAMGARTFAKVLEETKNQQVRELCLLLLGKTAPAQAAVALVEFVTSSESELLEAFSEE